MPRITLSNRLLTNIVLNFRLQIVWAIGGNLATARVALGTAGTQAAGLAFGGAGSSGYTAATEEYNGTAWATVGLMNRRYRSLAGAGTATAALGFAGYAIPAPSPTTGTEEYNPI
jgi:hypothetical protein